VPELWAQEARVRRIDVIARVREKMGESKEATIASFEHLAKSGGEEARAWIYQEISDEQTDQYVTSMEQALKAMAGMGSAERAAILSRVTGMSFSEKDLNGVVSGYASHKIKEDMRGARGTALQRTVAGDFKRQMVAMGVNIWPTAFRGRDPDDVLGAARRIWDEAKRRGDDHVMTMMHVPEYQRMLVFSARWAQYAFPVVQLHGHKYAAALMSTQPQDVEPMLPWPTFLLEVPLGLVTTVDDLGIEQPIEAAFVSRQVHDGKAMWHMQMIAIGGTSLHRWDIDFKDLFAHGKDLPTIDSNPAFQMQYENRDDRVWWLMARLLANVCVVMSDPDEVHELSRGKRSGLSPTPGNPDTSKIYRVGHPVDVDCRQAVSEYISGERRSGPTVRFVVRGHWRDQACGPGLSERRQKWIVPYWKGPEIGAINVRPHVVKETA
jgi:hypothetical protein